MFDINGDYLHILWIIGFIMMVKEKENNISLLYILKVEELYQV